MLSVFGVKDMHSRGVGAGPCFVEVDDGEEEEKDCSTERH